MGLEQRLFEFDAHLKTRKGQILAGIDEAGRGPLAGPVVAAAVIFRGSVRLEELNDSKKISAKLREKLFYQIISQSLVGVTKVSEEIIDQMNILQAVRLAMKEAVLVLPQTPEILLIDGPIKLDLPLSQISLIDGDAKSAHIAAASIVAKVFRDCCMEDLDRLYPDYGFARHKGYATNYHLKMLELKGASAVHRQSFRPVAELRRGDE